MNSSAASDARHPKYPRGFRPRRGLNWGFLGLLYTSFYMCRYNLSLANKSISDEFGFSKADMGAILTAALLAYAFGQIINGLLTDRIGGKKAMLIGAFGTIAMNILFGAASLWGVFSPAASHGSFGFFEKKPATEFVAQDFPSESELGKKIKTGTNAVSVYLRSQLSPETIRALSTNEDSSTMSPEQRDLLMADLNRVISGNSIYDTNRFADVKFSRGVRGLLASNPVGGEYLQLNRALIEESFPLDVRKSQQWIVKLPFFYGGIFIGLLTIFIAIRGIDGYLQAFGAPGMTKIKTAWFAQRERGGFSGIFGFMINLGRFGIFTLGPALLAGFTIFGLIQVPPLHWRWLFWVPSGICTIVAIGMAIFVDETPEAAGYPNVIPGDRDANGKEDTATRADFAEVFKKIVMNPAVWFVAAAYSCTGAVRQTVDQWFPRYMQEVYHADLQSAQFQWLGFSIPFVASAGSLLSGYASDLFFKGQRAPVAAGLYLIETFVILLAAQFHTATSIAVFFVLISFTANSTHSILGTAAAMDIGGRKMTGFAAGLIDSFQYFGGSLAMWILSGFLDKSWNYYFYFMAPFGAIGFLLMVIGRKQIYQGSKH